jgi:hypothetical protein
MLAVHQPIVSIQPHTPLIRCQLIAQVPRLCEVEVTHIDPTTEPDRESAMLRDLHFGQGFLFAFAVMEYAHFRALWHGVHESLQQLRVHVMRDEHERTRECLYCNWLRWLNTRHG